MTPTYAKTITNFNHLAQQIKKCSMVKELESVYASMIKANANQDCFLMNQFIAACSIFHRIDYAILAFTHMQEPNVFVYNAMIRALVQCYHPVQALDCYLDMVQAQVSPTSFTFSSLVKACSLVSELGFGEAVHGHIWKYGFDSHVFVQTALVDFYGNAGKIVEARRVFDEMSERDVFAWTTMISVHARTGDMSSARQLFDEMPVRNTASWNAMIDGYSRLRNVESAELLFSQMPNRDIISWTTMIACYSQNKHLDKSLVVFFKLRKKNLFCWNSIIEGLAVHGYAEEALAMFSRMQREKIKPNGVTFISVLGACTHAGLVEEGRKRFLSMSRDFSIPPEIEHYGCMVDLLGKAGLLEDALELVRSMRMEPNSVIWGALLGGCKLHRNLKIAQVAVNESKVLEPNNSGYYTLLVNMYAEVNRWSEVANIRATMKELGVEKTSPGSSWIEMDRKIHQFAASDKSHLASDEIYTLLVELDGQLKLSGYVPELGSVPL
ncbi:unnamed protein product, partial [Vitis vinifera]